MTRVRKTTPKPTPPYFLHEPKRPLPVARMEHYHHCKQHHLPFIILHGYRRQHAPQPPLGDLSCCWAIYDKIHPEFAGKRRFEAQLVKQARMCYATLRASLPTPRRGTSQYNAFNFQIDFLRLSHEDLNTLAYRLCVQSLRVVREWETRYAPTGDDDMPAMPSRGRVRANNV